MAEQRNVPPSAESSPEQTQREIDRYNVLLLNDDYTPMEFVMHVLERFFSKGREEATRIMLRVHQKGVGICGVYAQQAAEAKVAEVTEFSRKHKHPLQCLMEREKAAPLPL
jgi:ATP-dependent Clp protease adaptor protein ClpS